MALDHTCLLIVPVVATSELTATIDIYGNTIEIGSRVRSFDFPFEFDDGRLSGFSLNDARTSYIEGTVEAFEVTPAGNPGYKLTDIAQVHARNGRIVRDTADMDGPVYAPVNGLRGTMGGHTCGVVRIMDESVIETTPDDHAGMIDLIRQLRTDLAAAKVQVDAEKRRADASERSDAESLAMFRRVRDHRDALKAWIVSEVERTDAVLAGATQMSSMLLMAGEMTASERRTARAIATGLVNEIQSSRTIPPLDAAEATN